MTWPFENDTSAIEKKLARRSLQADKRRNIFLIVTIILTTALLSGMFFYAFAGQRKLESQLRGQYQVVVMETTQEEIDSLTAQTEIEQWGLSQNFGTARYQDSNLSIEYADDGWMVLGKKPSYIGTLPQAENEILVEQAFLNYFGLPQKTGQTIRLNLGNGEQDYTISGILQHENSSRIFSVIVSRDFLVAQAKNEPLFEFRFRFVGADRSDMDSLKADIAAFLADNNIPEERIFYSSNYFDMQGVQSKSVYVFVPVALIFLTACGLVIYSIFYVSIRGKLREYGRLKVLGATPRQIRQVIRRESFYLSVCSIPIGLVLGGLAGFVASADYWDWTKNLLVAIGVAGFTELTVMFSTHAPIRIAAKVSPIDAVRASGYQAESSRKSTRAGKHITPAYLAVMNFSRNPKKAVLTLLSLCMTGIFLFSAATVFRSVNVNSMAANSMNDGCNYTISWEGNPEEILEISRHNPLTQELREKVLAVNGVETMISRTSSAAFLTLPNGISDDFELHTFTREEMEELFPENTLVDGISDYDELVEKQGILITDSINEPMLSMLSDYSPQIGDVITFQPYGGEPVELTVMGIADGEKATKTTGIAMFTLPMDLAQQLYPDIENMDRVWNVFTSNDTDTLREELFSLLDDPLLNIYSRSDYAEVMAVSIQIGRMVLYGLFIFLFLFALVNLINTLITNLLSRQQEIGILQSVGLSGRQLSKMLTMECLCYVAVTLLITLVVGGFAGALLVILVTKSNLLGQLVYQFPILELLSFAVALILIQVIYSVFAVRYMRRKSLTERIKMTN